MTLPSCPHPADESRENSFEPLLLAGRGDFAEVWKVRDRRTGKFLARKQLRPDVERPAVGSRLLKNEAEVLSHVRSEFVVRQEENRLDSPFPCVLLEWLSGETLEHTLILRKLLPVTRALWIARQCAQGLHALSAAGFVHGDVKPSNVFLCGDGSVRLIDLGFARPLPGSSVELHDALERTLAGTPEYMAPEALVPASHNPILRDVYSLGVTLYRMLTGCLPFRGESVPDVLRRQQQLVPPRVRTLAPHVPAEVEDLTHRLLSKQPLRRDARLSSLIREFIGLELSAIESEAA